MPRPEKRTAEYFPFYVKEGRTLAVMQHKFGLAGIGFFTNLFRILASTPNHFVNLSSEGDMLYFASRIGCDESDVEMYLEPMFTTRKLDVELWRKFSIIYCFELVESLMPLYEKRIGAPMTVAEIVMEVSGAETPCKEDITDDGNPVSGNGNQQTKLYYTIGEERKPPTSQTPGEAKSSPTISPADPLKSAFIEAISQLLPTTAWPDIPKQMAALTDMAAMTRETQQSTPIETPEQFAQLVVSTYVAMKRKAKSDYWKTASYEPRAIKQRFGDVVTEISRQYSRRQQEAHCGADPF